MLSKKVKISSENEIKVLIKNSKTAKQLKDKLIAFRVQKDKDLVEWFKDFLQDRTQRLVIGNTFSESLTVFSGVHQGIGQLLFIIYINDIASEVDSNSNISFLQMIQKYLANLTSFYKNL